MVDLFKIKDTLANKISYYHLMALLASLPFDLFYSHLILISYIIHTLIHLNGQKAGSIFTLKNLALQSVFLVTLCSTAYSINKPEAFNEWGKQLTIFIFPILFCINPLIISKYREKLLTGFALVCTATIIYLFADAFVTIKHYRLPWSAIFSGAFTNHNFSEPIGMHATFFSMQLMVALSATIFSLINGRNPYSKLLCLVCSVVLTAGVIQLSSKSIFVALLILLNIGVPWLLLKGRARFRFVMISLSFSILAIAGILATSAFKERFITELKADLAKPVVGETYDSRLARWETTVELIKKKPLTGYGAGTEIGLLHDSFYKKKMYDSFLQGLNGHNEYLSIALKSGVFGLLIYLATLAWGFKIAIGRKDLLLFNFMMLIAIVSFSENLLDVDKGIFFYAFFFSFFMFSHKKKPEDPVPELRQSLISSPNSEILADYM
jgi:O-antigen ligase